MKKGDLVKFNDQCKHLGLFGTITCDPYSKAIWGDHPEDIEIASMISVLFGPGFGESTGKIQTFRYSHLKRIASIVR
tara:strand:- start:7851 stop:8081 length:231 start_codon:yes stop_codon:yes gene_type:complete